MYPALTAAIAPLNLRSCLISRRGRLEFEHYRDSATAREIAKINSCTKSILSALLCIALDRELLPGPETLASEFFPTLASSDDRRKRKITLEHLLTMTAGFEWTEFGGRNSFPRMTRSPNWVRFVLEQPLADEPGKRMEYNSGISQLLSSILTQASGMTAARFAEMRLFGPLGIEEYEWESDPQGIYAGGFGMRLRPMDMLKFGQLYLRNGRWENRSLIPEELVARSVRTAALSEDPRPGGYGWHWWTGSYSPEPDRSSCRRLDYFYARGYGGQFIYVVPAADAVVVLTKDQGKRQKPIDVFREFIAPELASRLDPEELGLFTKPKENE
ncbi:serine hydrolase domain-containing protein [Cohnella zeiphila]|uniref:Serine hydrolase n=1 Tax=Cohnella zeiphila TaxID=2761120 RepID=A0A7X0SKJ3_9BACL|nr:serine hydrolase [Cohnella zeiphila]MBB6730410.1 serine hydrolase [Cohnella zeiphila]